MAKDEKIVRAAIHPGIGIARIGNSEEFFIGPEVLFPPSAPPNFYKDAAGALKRQAARFRVYGYNQAGEVVKELTAKDAEINWTVHVANKKAAWYNFEIALDIPEAIPCTRRNAAFTGERRKELVIDPGPRSIAGANEHGPQYYFDSGEFVGKKVYLGELQTDEQGNLIFLGGRGVSDTAFPNNTVYTFANNDGWYDDTSDGPVYATVKLRGQDEILQADPAWVIVGPPNYAPDVISVQTIYDVMYDAFQDGWIEVIEKPSFTEHIYPILRQFCDSQWVNYGFYVQFGWGGPNDFMRPHYLNKLSTITEQDIYAEVRLQLFNIFRDPKATILDVDAWPQMYGDAITIPATGPRALMSLTETQYGFLKQWAAGNFIPDWKPNTSPPPQQIEKVKLQKRPHTLDKAALYYCLGGPFHPGCEMTWPMRHTSMYYAPFRIRPRGANQPEPDYGDLLTPQVAKSEYGPLFSNGPGDITRWMAVPWQTDTASCRAGYQESYDPYIPTFWPARVPNHVLALEEYERVMNKKLPEEKRLIAFNTRATWYRWLEGGYLSQIAQMISDFGKLGVVERRDGLPDDESFPPVMYVESQVGFEQENVPAQRNTIIGAAEKITRPSRQIRSKMKV
jgi:hypothetical protein